jgi:multidrug efflux pump subunit AcrA (membrane-fusion protein)
MVKYGLPILAAVGLTLAAVSVKRMTPVRASVAPPSAPPAAAFPQQIGAVGLVEASSENVAIGVPVPGLVTAVHVEIGQRVKKGQPLFTLDDRDLRAELALRESNLALTRTRLEKLLALPRPEEIPPAQARVREAEALLQDTQVQLRLIESVKDPRAIREEDLLRRRRAVEAATARLEEAKAALALLEAGSWDRDLAVARAEVAQAEQQVERIRTDIARMTVTAPINGVVLQRKVRAGEYAAAGPLPQPLILLGATGPLHVRADVDEKDAWRFRAGAGAYASVRGNGALRLPLTYVRTEPYVIPKKNLTGDATERVDTRVLQVIYALDNGARVYAGQQMDVFIDAKGEHQ